MRPQVVGLLVLLGLACALGCFQAVGGPRPTPPAGATVATPTPASPTASPTPGPRWRVAWQRPLGPVSQPPRVGRGLVYVFVGNDVLAFEAATGALRWQYTAPPLEGEAAALGCPCARAPGLFGGQGLYVLGGPAELRALDDQTGQPRWTRSLGRQIVTPTVSAQGTVVVGAVDDQGPALLGLAEATGAVRWRRPVPAGFLPWLALDPPVVLALTLDRQLLAVDPTDGRERWRQPLPAEAVLPETDRVGGGQLVVLVPEGVMLLETTTGQVRWRARVQGWPGEALVVGPLVVVSTFDGEVVALEAATGQRRWAHTGALGRGLASDGEVLYVPGQADDLLALDLGTGRVRWRQPVGPLFAPAVIAGERLWAGTTSGEVVALARATGAEQARLTVGETTVFSPVVGEEPAAGPACCADPGRGRAGETVYVVTAGPAGSALVALRPEAG